MEGGGIKTKYGQIKHTVYRYLDVYHPGNAVCDYISSRLIVNPKCFNHSCLQFRMGIDYKIILFTPDS